MKYVKSSARRYFEADSVTILKTARAVRVQAVGNKNPQLYSVQQAVFKASVVQINSALEKYIESVFENWVQAIIDNKKTVADVPKELIWWDAANKQLSAFKKFFLDQDEKLLVATLSNNDKLAKLFDPLCSMTDILNRSSILQKKYPSVSNLEKTCKRFGIEDVFAELGKRTKSDLKRQFKSFSDVRTSIAHYFPSDDLTYSDLLKNAKFIATFVMHLDRLLNEKVCKTSGSNCWT